MTALLALLALGPAPQRPNVLFLHADDLRADAVAALGSPVARTPNLDALVRRGFHFTRAYNLGSDRAAVCTPSRNMLLGGRAFFRYPGPLAPADGPSFARALRAAGYLTYHHGKRGNTAPRLQAQFEVNKYLADDEAERRTGEPGKEIADAAVDFLWAGRDGRPFAMYLGFSNPHDPRVAAPHDLARFDRDRLPLPANYLPVHPFDNGEQTVRDELLAPWPRTPAEVRRHLHEYHATTAGLDRHIGRVLATLTDLGLEGNTLVVFSSDHGLAVGSHGLMGKQSLYEHSARVPLVVAGPGVPAGRSDAPAYLLDVFPTVCDYAGAATPDGLDGRSLKPVGDGRSAGVRDAVFLAYRDVQRAVRAGDWKLIRHPQVDRTQLFDLRTDPDERTDLSGDPAHAATVARLTAKLAELQKQFGDPAPLSVPHPKPAAFVPPTGAELDALRKRWKL